MQFQVLDLQNLTSNKSCKSATYFGQEIADS